MYNNYWIDLGAISPQHKDESKEEITLALALIPDVSSLHGFCSQLPKLSPFDFSFRTKLQVPTSNLFTSSSNTKRSQIPNEIEIETRYLFYWSSDSVESYSPLRGLRVTQRRSALEDHEGHSSWSHFQLLFLLPLVNSFPCGGGIELVQTFEAYHSSWVLSGDA